MRKLLSAVEGTIFDVYEDDSAQLYLVVLCQGIAWARIGVVLTEDECSQFRASPHALDALARSVCYDFSPFQKRAVPDSIRRQIEDLDEEASFDER